MQWGKIKTIFILCFFLLNIYLLILFLNKQAQSDVGLLENEESTLEDQLEAENISYVELPEEESKESFISVGHKVFTEEDLKLINKNKDQETILINDSFILSQFNKKPIIDSEKLNDKAEAFVRETIGISDEYVFWNWNKESNVLIFFQEINKRPVYFNPSGMVLVFLNENNEISFYTQTMLGEAETRQEKKTLIKPLKAIETIYNINELNPGDNINRLEIGFHTRVPSSHGIQVFVPTWKVTVNKERSYFINAIEGFVFSSNEINFLEETMNLYQEIIGDSENRNKINKDIIEMFEEKLDLFSRGG